MEKKQTKLYRTEIPQQLHLKLLSEPIYSNPIIILVLPSKPKLNYLYDEDRLQLSAIILCENVLTKKIISGKLLSPANPLIHNSDGKNYLKSC